MDLFYIFTFVQCILIHLELALSQHLLLDAGQTGPIIAQIPADFVQIFSSQQQIPALTLNSDSHPLQHLQNQPEVASSALPKLGISQHPMRILWGNFFFPPVYLALKGSETLQ